jgi:4-hydroxyacetophenone monooxygenase
VRAINRVQGARTTVSGPNASQSSRKKLAAAVRDEAQLRAALEETDIVPQLLLGAQLTGQSDLLNEARPHITGGWSFQETLPEELKARIRNRLVEALKASAAKPDDLVPPTAETFRELLSVGVGTAVPTDYADLLLEETFEDGVDGRRVDWRREVSSSALAGFKVIVIGAGLAGLCMALKLRQAGIPFVVFEKNDSVGGTWYENSYPGAGVDIPNHFYSYAFEAKHDWSYHFAKRDELWGYLDNLADKWDVRGDIRFGTEVTQAIYDEKSCTWSVTVRRPDGETETLPANVVVTAVGQLNRPAIPKIPGLDSFSGSMFHTADWDHKQNLEGRRVALVGTGASSMQVGPAIVDRVAQLLVFQRSPSWAANNPNYLLPVKDGMKWALANIPYFAKWYRFLLFWASGDLLHASLQIDPQWPHPDRSLNAANDQMRDDLIAYIRSEIGDDPELLAKVIPNYPPYGKRMLRDNNWYKMLKRDNVELIDTAVKRIEPDALVDESGERHAVDVIVFATGFQATRMLFPMEIAGRDGRSLRELWGEDDARAHLGITVPGFPNLFIVYGPNTNLSHGGSLFFHAELQVRYIMQALREMIEGGYRAMECRQEPHDIYNQSVDEAHNRMVWTHGGMKNWYRNSAGRVVANSPWRLIDYWRMTAEMKPWDFRFTPKHKDRDDTMVEDAPLSLAG